MLSSIPPRPATERANRLIPGAHGDTVRGYRRSLMPNECKHVAGIRDVTPSALGCEECLKIGSPWVHLRLCLYLRPCRLLR